MMASGLATLESEANGVIDPPYLHLFNRHWIADKEGIKEGGIDIVHSRLQIQQPVICPTQKAASPLPASLSAPETS